jgi:hypothetical protein
LSPSGLLGKTVMGTAFRRWKDKRDARQRTEFAELLQEALHELSAAGRYRIDADAFALIEDSSRTRWPLSEAYERFIQAPPESREELIGWIAQTVLVPPIPTKFASARDGLIPELQARSAHELTRQTSPSSCAAALPIAENLVVCIHYEGERRRHACSEAMLDHWGLTPERALAIALENLQMRTTAQLVEGPSGTYRSPPEDPSGATLLLLESLIRSVPVRGQPVIMVPARNVLFLSGSDDPKGLQTIADMAFHSIRATRTLSGSPLALGPGGWTRYSPADGALQSRLRLVEIPVELQDYVAQKPLLEALLRQNGARVQVGDAVLGTTPDQRPYTWCTWAEGRDCLLPHVDYIQLVRAGEREGQLIVPWNVAVKELSGLMESTAYYPRRTRVRSFPSTEQLRMLSRRGSSALG